MKIIFMLILAVFFNSALAQTDIELIEKGKANQIAEKIRATTRLSKNAEKLPDLFLINILRRDHSAFVNDYNEFYTILLDTLTKQRDAIAVTSDGSDARRTAENNFRVWQDFVSTIVNSISFYSNTPENSWVPGVGQLKGEIKKVGTPDPLWATLNSLAEADIYYANKDYIQAEIKGHDALAHFFLTNPNSIGGNVALVSILQYFKSTTADRKMSEMLADVLVANQQSKNPIALNPYSTLDIYEFMINTSTNEKLNVIVNPEIVKQSAANLDVETKQTWFDDLGAGITSKAIVMYLEGEEEKASEYFDKYFIKNDHSFDWELLSGLIKKERNIPSRELQVEFDEFFKLMKNNENTYAYKYAEFFRSMLKTVGYINQGEKYRADQELLKSADSLYWIANINNHPPGTTLPSLFRLDRSVLDCFMKLIINSDLGNREKTKAIEVISSLSLISREYEYVSAIDLIDNTKTEYGRNLAISYTSYLSKREILYKELFKNYLATAKDFKPNVHDYLGLISANARLNNLLIYLHKTKLVERKEKLPKKNITNNDLLINLFCLEAYCYAYKNQENKDITLTYENKKNVAKNAGAFIDAIKNGGDGQKESEMLSRFIFRDQSNLTNIKNCHIVATSGLSGLPASLLTINGKYLIDFCNVSTYTSLQHFERSRAFSNPSKREKWALSIAAPVIRNEKDIKAIEDTLSLIRGGTLLENLPELPETADEADAIVEINRARSTLLLGSDANKNNLFRENLSNYHVLSFSTHGLMAGESSNNMTPAILMTSSDKGALLTTRDILDLNGAPSLVVLAICNASTPSMNFVNSEISSVANAFLMKGSEAVISTLWPLNSNASVKILKSTFKKINDGESLSEAVQKSALEYRDAHPNSKPKDWGAFIVFGNTHNLKDSLAPSNRAVGFPIDISMSDNEINIIGQKNNTYFMDIWDKKTLAYLRKIPLPNVRDAKFLSQNSKNYLAIKNNDIKLFEGINSQDNFQEKCSIKTDEFWKINSLITIKDKTYVITGGRKDGFTNVSYIDRSTCKSSAINFNLQNTVYPNNSILALIDQSPSVFATKEIPADNVDFRINKYTENGLIKSCHFQYAMIWNQLKIQKDGQLSFADGSSTEKVKLGLALPFFSHSPLNFISSKDYCSDRTGLMPFDSFSKNNQMYEPEVGSAPWNVFSYFTSGKLTIKVESFFNGFDAGRVWDKLQQKNSDNHMFVTAKIDDKQTKYIAPLSECASFVGLEDNGTGFIACGDENGYSIHSVH